jgi:ubiquitin-protein ligase
VRCAQAIALSMEAAGGASGGGGGGGGAAPPPWAPAAGADAGAAPPPWAPAAAAAPPPWAPAAAAPPAGNAGGAAAQATLAANAAAAAAMFANLFAPAPGGAPQQQQPHHHHHQAPPQPQRFPAPTYPPSPIYPRWWDECAKASPAAGVPPAGVALPDEAAALAALSVILGAPLAPMPAPPGAPPPHGDAIPLPLAGAFGAPGGRILTERALASAVRSRVAPRRMAKGDTELSVIAAAHARAAATPPPAGAPGPLLALARAALARHVATSLEADAGDDLYFEGGRQRSAFAASLASRHVTPALLDDIVAFTASDKAAALWEDMLRSALSGLKGTASMDDIADIELRLVPLDRLTGCAPLARALGGMLHAEAAAAAASGGALRARGGGGAFEARSCLAPLLAFSALPGAGGALSAPGGAPFRALRGYPRCAPGERERVAGVVGAAAARAHAAAHAVLERVAKQKGPALEAVLAWLAAAAAAGAPRTLAGGVHANPSAVAAARGATSDAFAVGVAALALRFCRPFLGGAPAQLARLLGGAPYAARWRLDRSDEDTLRTGVDATAIRSDFDARLSPTWRPFFVPIDAPLGAAPSLSAAPSLGAVASGSSDAPPLAAAASSSSASSAQPPPCSSDAPPHFVTQCFHLAAYALHTGLLPAIEAFERARYRASSHAPHEALASDVPFNVLIDTGSAALLDPQLAGDACRFALLASAALLRTAQLGDVGTARAAFAAMPAAAARDVGALVSFVLNWGRADLLSGAASEHVPVAAAVEAAAALLSRRDLVSSPLVVGALVDTLHAMLAADRSASRASGAAGLGRTGSAAHDALVGAVLANPAARRSLAPALIVAYASLDAVEGLDVDRDAFDKFTVRHKIARLLGELWAQPECAASVAAMAAADVARGAEGDSAFGAFASAALLDLMYLLQDALARLVDIRDVQAAREDGAAWAAQAPGARADKERFLDGQENAARGFMGQARATLTLLNTLAATPAVAAAFLSQPVAGGAAYAAVHFLELLLGPRCEELRVANPEKYKFDPRALLLGIVEFLLRLDAAGAASGNADAFAAAVSSEDDYSREVLEKAGGVMSKRGVGDAAHVARLRAFIDRCEALRATRHGAAAAAAPSNLADAASVASGSAAAPPAELDASWERAYVDAMAPLLYGDVEPGGLGGYFRQFEELAARPEGQQKAKAKRLAREVGALSAPGGLPLAPGSAIVVRTDGERPDKMRAMLTGPSDTPYALGAFVFDIYFPADYPLKAPLVNFDTTGGGRVRMNPNLYADGKVCLSLLGTWHAGHASEKWDPALSSLSQVLLSIQAMILVDEPWYNEPGADALRGTPEGARKAAEYNEEIQLFTLRYAMLAQLRKPRPGLEDAIGAHFRAAAPAVRARVAAWVAAAGDATRKARMAEAAAELNAELDALLAGGGACGGGGAAGAAAAAE